jgi:SAM-dependent methyltransferase
MRTPRDRAIPRPEPGHLHETRVFYDTIAEDYARHFATTLQDRPLDRALLAGFAELAQTINAGPIADLGCGPGHITAHLHQHGVDVFGVDLSSATVDLARRTHPGLSFRHGSMTDLEIADGALGGIVAWYSIIHLPPDQLPTVFAEFYRLLAGHGHLLLAFQVGDEILQIAQPFGHPVSLGFRRLAPDRIDELLRQTGFKVDARLVREPIGEEKVAQGFLVAHKPTRTSGAPA